MLPKVSIVIPVYNTEQYLIKCLESICNQTLKEIEIIIVNDGSPDHSQEIINQYRKRDIRIKSIVQENAGLGEARNAGMMVSTGEYIAFVDSDDWVELNMYQIMLNTMEENSADIAICNTVKVFADGSIAKKAPMLPHLITPSDVTSPKVQFDYFIGAGYGASACNKLYRKKFLLNNRLRFEKNNEIFAEDMLFNLMCLLDKPLITVMEDYLYNYYIHNNSIIQSYKPKLAERMINLNERFEIRIKNRGLEAEFEELSAMMILNAFSISMYNACFYGNKRPKAMRSELDYFMQHEFIKQRMIKVAKGKYLGSIDNLMWKVHARIFAILICLGLRSLACYLQSKRFKKITSAK